MSDRSEAIRRLKNKLRRMPIEEEIVVEIKRAKDALLYFVNKDKAGVASWETVEEMEKNGKNI